MEIKDFHDLLNQNELVDIQAMIDDENLFYFKSKYSDVEFLGYGKVEVTNCEITKTPKVFIGKFEGSKKYFTFENYILKNETNYHLSIIKPPVISLDQTNSQKDFSNYQRINLTEFDLWKNQIQTILEIINTSKFKKIVLSRDIKINFEDLNLKSFINKIFKINQFNYRLYFRIFGESFVSVTPEKLFSINNKQITSMSLAGSMPVTKNQIETIQNKNILINDQKLINEHQHVTDEIQSRFTKIANDVSVCELKILELPYIQHRLQDISGILKNEITIDQIIDELHPTPAVGTMPYQNGIQTINEIEGKKRNFYAAPFGIISQGYTELIVGLRSATIIQNTAQVEQIILHTGCGIVSGSTAESEWDETENKLKPFLQVLLNE